MNLPSSLSDRRARISRVWIWILILSQPVLDALSYWAAELDMSTTLTLGVRMLILAVTVVIAFALSEQKRAYYLTAGVLAVFWAAHVFACRRVGYVSPMTDVTNYIRVAQMPVYTLALITLLRRAGNVPSLIEKALAADLWIIAAISLLAVVTGTNNPTYPKWGIGVSGWFALPNSQSAIYGVLTLITVLSAIRENKPAAAALRCAASYEGAGQKSELLLIPASGAGDEDETPDKLAREAEIVAARIEALLAAGTPVTQDGVTRPAQSGDVAILLRSANKYGAVFRTALLRRGIGVSSAQGKDFFGSEEIASLISLLAVIDNPHRDIDLIAALRAPCFGFTPDELSLIRAEDGKADFYGCLRLRAEHDEKARAFVEKLAALRALAPDVGCAELVWQLIGELDLLAIASAMTDGERRRGNLMELLSLSESFESTGYRGLHRFVLWLRRLAEKGQEVGGAASAGVRILSVHKSKGLEFPIVFFCDLARRFNQSDSMARVLVHPDLGLGAKVTDLQRRIEYPTLARTAIAERLRRETLSEEMRLLYVALTRPKEYLFMTACVKDPEKLIEKARLNAPHSLAPEVLSSAASPLGWLLAAAIRDDGAHIALRLYEERDGREAEMDARPAVVPDAAFGERLARNLAFRYPHADAVGLPSKLTATELKDHAEGDEEAASLAPPRPRRFREPDFSRADKPLRGAERGTATHLVLQYMDFERTDSEQAVRAEIERMRQARYLTDREAEAVDAKAIVTLFSSPLGRRMRAAQTIRREFKFSLLTDARELFGKAGGDKLLLQGVVDCCIEEDGELVVIDYKTDAITTDEELEARSALYTPQLRAYAVAMERIFGKRVKECVLYFLSMGREARVAPDRGGQEGRETT